MIMCHNCLYLHCITMCKGLLVKTEFMLLAVKLENVSQDRIYISLSVWLFISCFCFYGMFKVKIHLFSDLIS